MRDASCLERISSSIMSSLSSNWDAREPREVRLRNRNNVEKKEIKCMPYSGLAHRDQFGLLRASAVNVASTRAHGLS